MDWRWPVAVLVAGLAAIACLLLVDTRRRRTARMPQLQLARQALWATGEVLWSYDLRQRLLQLIEVVPDASGKPGLGHDRRPLPPIHPDDLPGLRQRLDEHLHGGARGFSSEQRMALSDGHGWTWVRVRGRVVERDADGQPLQLAGSARSVNRRRHADVERRIASEVLHSMSEAVAVLDGELCFLSINAAFSRITGYDEQQVLGQPVSILDHISDSGGTPALREAMRSAGRWQGDAWKLRRDGQDILCHLRHNVVFDSVGEPAFHVLVLEDITEQKRAEQELRYLANYDTLTGLPNRTLFSERLARSIVRARRRQCMVAVLFLDLDRFKNINDSLGHAVGDRVLRHAAERIQQAVGPQHTAARISGDEFTVILDDVASAEQAESSAQQVLAAFDPPLRLDERREVTISPSIGISLYPQHAQIPSELLRHADTAMYRAKSAGRRNVQTYSPEMDASAQYRATLASSLRGICLDRELAMVYQPRYSLAHSRIVGVEALMRWNSAEFGPIAPSQFIPLAEETGVILEMGEWALRQACLALKQWQRQGIEGVGMSVNVSAVQLQRGDLPDVVARILAETGVAAGALELELTETVVMANVGQNAATLRACRALGVRLSIDDFGTGYSSLAYLKRLPITTLKIDQEFIGDLTRDPDDEAITSTIIAMGHSLALEVVAEGVEDAGQLEFLRRHGCDEIQGFLLSPPLQADACLDFMRQPVVLPPAS